jgi:hypothetical protein
VDHPVGAGRASSRIIAINVLVRDFERCLYTERRSRSESELRVVVGMTEEHDQVFAGDGEVWWPGRATGAKAPTSSASYDCCCHSKALGSVCSGESGISALGSTIRLASSCANFLNDSAAAPCPAHLPKRRVRSSRTVMTSLSGPSPGPPDRVRTYRTSRVGTSRSRRPLVLKVAVPRGQRRVRDHRLAEEGCQVVESLVGHRLHFGC